MCRGGGLWDGEHSCQVGRLLRMIMKAYACSGACCINHCIWRCCLDVNWVVISYKAGLYRCTSSPYNCQLDRRAWVGDIHCACHS